MKFDDRAELGSEFFFMNIEGSREVCPAMREQTAWGLWSFCRPRDMAVRGAVGWAAILGYVIILM